MATAQWKVHSHHLAVPAGDCAIHLLVKEPPKQPKKPKERPEIHRAVLIDGGKTRAIAASIIQNAIAVINNSYGFAAGLNFEDPYPVGTKNKSLRFDSIVITHWDTDHFEGVLQLLANGFEISHQECQKELGNIPANPKKKTKAQAPAIRQHVAGNDVFLIPNWYCKYKPGDSGKKATEAPMWTIGTTAGVSNVKGGTAKISSEYMAKMLTTLFVPYAITDTILGDFSATLPAWTHPHLVANLDVPRTGSQEFATLKMSNFKTATGQVLYLPNLAKVLYRAQDYLGYDLWTGTSVLGTVVPTDVKGPSGLMDLIRATNKKPAKPIYFVIIAGDQFCMGSAKISAKMKEDPSSIPLPLRNSTVIAEKASKLNDRENARKNRTEDGVEKNAASIVALIIGDTGETTQKDKFKIMHYTGGDVLWDVEATIGLWLVTEIRNNKKTKTSGWVCRTSAMKLSHHGSRGTTSLTLLNALHPDYFIASSASSGNYGHPSLETVVMLHAQAEFYQRQASLKSTVFPTAQEPPLLCTGYPSWCSSKILDKWPDFAPFFKTKLPKSAAGVFQAVVKQRFGSNDTGNVIKLFQVEAATRTEDPKAKTAKSVFFKILQPLVKSAYHKIVPPVACKPSEDGVSFKLVLDPNLTIAPTVEAATVPGIWVAIQTAATLKKAKGKPKNSVAGPRTFAPMETGSDPPVSASASKKRRRTNPDSTAAPNKRVAMEEVTIRRSIRLQELQEIKEKAKAKAMKSTQQQRKLLAELNGDEIDLEADYQDFHFRDAFPQSLFDELGNEDTSKREEDGDTEMETEEGDGGETPMEMDSDQPLRRMAAPTPPNLNAGDWADPAMARMIVSEARALAALPARGRDGGSSSSFSDAANHPPRTPAAPGSSRIGGGGRMGFNATLPDSSPPLLLLSSALEPPDDAAVEYAMLDLDSITDRFVAFIPEGFLVVSRDSETQLSVSDESDWGAMVISGGLELGNLRLELDRPIADNKASVVDVKVDVFVGGWPVPFTCKAAGVDPALKDSPDDDGMIVAGGMGMLVLGIADAPEGSKLSFDFGDVLDFIAPPWFKVAWVVVEDMAGSIDDVPKFQCRLITGRPHAKGGRNLLALGADLFATTQLRLEFDLQDSAQTLLQWLASKDLFPLKTVGALGISNLKLVVLKEASSSKDDDEVRSSVRETLSISGTIDDKVHFWLKFEPASAGLVLRFDGLNTSAILGWLSSKLNLDAGETDAFDKKSIEDAFPSPAPEFTIHQVEIAIANDGGTKGKLQCAATMELRIFSAIFMVKMSISSSLKTFRADVWTSIPTEATARLLLPSWEEFHDIKPAANEDELSGEVNFLDMVKDSEASDDKDTEEIANAAPDKSLFELEQAWFQAVKVGDSLTVNFFARVIFTPPTFDFPMIWPDYLEFAADYSNDGTGGTEWGVTMTGQASFPPYVDAGGKERITNAMLGMTVTRTDSAFVFEARAHDLGFADLYSYFAAGDRADVVDLLGGLGVPFIVARFEKAGSTMNLGVNGQFEIKKALGDNKEMKFLLDFDYSYSATRPGPNAPPGAPAVPKNKFWELNASLSVNLGNQPGGLLDMIGALLPSQGGEDDDNLFDQIREMPFLEDLGFAVPTTTGQPAMPPVMLKVASTATAVVMWLRIELFTNAGTVTALLLQHKKKVASAPPPARGTTPLPSTPAKRYFRLRLDNLPMLKKVPVIGEISAPVDALDYVFVQDSTKPQAGKVVPLGLFPREIEDMNLAVSNLPQDERILFKEVVSQMQTEGQQSSLDKMDAGGRGSLALASGDKPALRAGHHFMMIDEGKVVLDHLFGQKPPQDRPKKSATGERADEKEERGPATGVVNHDSGSTYGPSQRAAPNNGLAITNVGVRVKEKKLFILVDGKLSMGGTIDLEFEGFGIGLPLAKLKEPASLTIHDFEMVITGLGVMFSKPPIVVAGAFRIEKTAEFELYMGGLTVTIPPYSMTAVGAYQKTKLPKEFKSVFLYGRFDGILFSLEFADVRGVAVSFGYNYALRQVQPHTLENFPLLKKQDADANPMKLISNSEPGSFRKWLTTMDRQYFFSFGLTVNALQALTVEAAVILAVGAQELSLSLVGRATAMLPPAKPGSGKSPVTLLYAELNLMATINVLGGHFMVGAELSSNSYILHPTLSIHGGFALCYWFPPSPNAGDWVFSVGGYHPAFRQPAHWPVPTRVGVTWSVTKSLMVTGKGFFAITPKAVMGGGELLATFRAGPIYADFELRAAFLLNFKPLFLTAEVLLRVTVGFRGHVGLISWNIKGTISANIYLEGPPFRGHLRLDFKIIHTTIKFGEKADRLPPLTFDQFVKAVEEPGLVPSPESSVPGRTDKQAMVAIALSAGAAPDEMLVENAKDKGAGASAGKKQKWVVRAAAFRFRVESKFAVSDRAVYPSLENKGPNEPVNLDGRRVAKADIYAKLTHQPATLHSRMTITVKRKANGEVEEGEWTFAPIVKKLPKGLWEKYDAKNDPTAKKHGDNGITAILNSSSAGDSTIEHVVGYSMVPPRPTLPDRTLQFPAFDVMEGMSEGVFAESATAGGGGSNGTKKKKVFNPKSSLLPEPFGQSDLRPPVPPAAAEDGRPDVMDPNAEENKEKNREQWMGLEFWKQKEEDEDDEKGVQQGVVDLVQDLFGWKGTLTVPRHEKDLLTAKTPRLLLANYDKYYMSDPGVAADYVS